LSDHHRLSGLPFQNEVNTGFGILVKVYIDATVAFNEGVTLTEQNAETEETKAAKENAIGILEDTFVTVKAPADELKRGFRFWDAVSVSCLRSFFSCAHPVPNHAAVHRGKAYRSINGSWYYSGIIPCV
jgi:hypothetical protein